MYMHFASFWSLICNLYCVPRLDYGSVVLHEWLKSIYLFLSECYYSIFVWKLIRKMQTTCIFVSCLHHLILPKCLEIAYDITKFHGIWIWGLFIIFKAHLLMVVVNVPTCIVQDIGFNIYHFSFLKLICWRVIGFLLKVSYLYLVHCSVWFLLHNWCFW